MKTVVKILLGLLVVGMVGGLLVPLVDRTRQAAVRTQCRNNLKQIGMCVHNYQGTYNGRFPSGTVPNPDLIPEKRLSWLFQIAPFTRGGVHMHIDKQKAWDSEENSPPRFTVRVNMEGETRDLLPNECAMDVFFCPANPEWTEFHLPSPTHFVGIGGVGEDTAKLPLSDPRAGFFGYDRKLKVEDIKDGAGTTLMVTETMNGGPWTAGGQATIRGLDVDGPSYLGKDGQFPSNHRNGSFLDWSPPVLTNVLFVDCSVRPFTGSVSSEVFEALATIAGGEKVDPFGDD